MPPTAVSRAVLRSRTLLGRRAFATTPARNAASAFTMPAMSPTMTEGTITSWKVAEGSPFATGDVLLEIETDKAQMDVEAQDDGVLAKILVRDGEKAVAVGTNIAVLAEPGDDLASLGIAEIANAAAPAKAESLGQQQQQQQRQQAAPDSPSKAAASPRPAPPGRKPQHHPSPSVMHLLKQHSLDAAAIEGSGPRGRLLKGDILAHLQKIPRSASSELSERIRAMGKLDLSNIKIKKQAPQPAKSPAAAAAAAAAPPKQPEAVEKDVTVHVSFGEVIKVQQRMRESVGACPPLSAFIERASRQANRSVPAEKSSDDLFDEVLGLAAKTRPSSFKPSIAPAVGVRAGPTHETDIIDILSGKVPARTRKPAAPTEGILAGGKNVLSVKVKGREEEERARLFLGTVKGLLEEQPGELVL